MKRLIVVLFLICLSRLCFADVTAEIIGKEIDGNGNIVVKTQYKIDGVEVPSQYPLLNGKYYWVTRYNVISFTGMTNAQIIARIGQDLKAFSEHLIIKPFQEQQVIDLKNANQTFFNSDNFKNIEGSKLTTTTAKMIVDTNFDGVQDKEWTCKTDGTKTETPYTPPTP